MTRPGPRKRGYGDAWAKARAGFLLSHPWCRMCAEEGRQVKAVHVHHSVPHRGGQRLFWDKSKWVPLCTEHHNRDAQQIETRGYRGAVGDDGIPVDPNHPWHGA